MPQPPSPTSSAGANADTGTSDATEPGPALNPGDEAAPGTEGTGEAICPVCGGSGQDAGRPCAECGGSGKVIVGVGGG